MDKDKTIIWLIVLVAIVILFNQYQMYGLTKGTTTGTNTGITTTAAGIDVTPKGTPSIYGSELGVSYDSVSVSNQQLADSTIKKLGDLDNSITLQGDNLKRYINIVSQISCEYCCGAKSIIFPDGKAACGCAHSYAMRGLAKYLLSKHSSEYTDDQILEELGKWKVLFFPGVHAQKAAIMQQKGIELNYINLASNKYRDIEKGAAQSGGSMVGGC